LYLVDSDGNGVYGKRVKHKLDFAGILWEKQWYLVLWYMGKSEAPP